ncbi:tRNA pseudouridine(38-40) synthase TruA [Teredinibacter purpureus]|uniref:tRNA pseudouridine(38-40) synthase TruA n=1 Tax=Teredinibacter purpureus TaxID=2731756 RepID=UPI0009E413E9|nr:tRNA pseudouridine(38-40) synthase TruA [Teredinibacter purpureus]
MSYEPRNTYIRNVEIKTGMLFPDGMSRIALGIEYSGSGLNGFQKQTSTQNTVQHHIESALSYVADEPVTLVCAGRTDAGVHASGQVVHFDTLAIRPSKAWVQGANARLPSGIRIHWAQAVDSSFHARFSAQARRYRYVIHAAPVRSAVMGTQVTWTGDALDLPAMQSCVTALLGVHDFSAFRASQCQARSPIREMQRIGLYEVGQFIVLDITANAFLHHMVRNIVGAVLDIGRGRRPVDWLATLLKGRDRTLSAATAPPHGLYLVTVDYPVNFGLPNSEIGPSFLAPKLER